MADENFRFKDTNEIRLTGYLGVDPEKRVNSKGNTFCSVSLCVRSKSYKDKETGVIKPITEWYRIYIYSEYFINRALSCAKGQMISIKGSLSQGGKDDIRTYIHIHGDGEFLPTTLRNEDIGVQDNYNKESKYSNNNSDSSNIAEELLDIEFDK